MRERILFNIKQINQEVMKCQANNMILCSWGSVVVAREEPSKKEGRKARIQFPEI